MKRNKGFTLIEIMIIIAIIGIMAAALIPAIVTDNEMEACVDRGGVPKLRLTGEIRDGDSVKEVHCVMPQKANSSTTHEKRHAGEYGDWLEAAKDCPSAMERIKNFTREGDFQLVGAEKMIIEDEIEYCRKSS